MTTPHDENADRPQHTDDADDASPPTYPAYSTPPSQGLPDAEHD